MEWTFSDSVRLSLLSFSEASKACAALPGFSLFRRSLQPERIEYCRAELLPDCLVGSLAVPDKTHPLHLAFSDRLDAEDFIDDAYIMEVSSPGLGRPLKKEKDYKRSMGKELEIRTYRAIERNREFYGILTAYDDNSVTIEEEDGTERVFQKSDIALIRLAFDF